MSSIQAAAIGLDPLRLVIGLGLVVLLVLAPVRLDCDDRAREASVSR